MTRKNTLVRTRERSHRRVKIRTQAMEARKVSPQIRLPSLKQPCARPIMRATTTRAMEVDEMEATATDTRREAITIEGHVIGRTETATKAKVAIMTGIGTAVTTGEVNGATIADIENQAVEISTSNERKSSTSQLSTPTRTTESSTAMTPSSSPRLSHKKKAPLSSRSTSSRAIRSSKRQELKMAMTLSLKWT